MSERSILTLSDFETMAMELETQDEKSDPEYALKLGKAIWKVRNREWNGAIQIEGGFGPAS